MKQLCQPERVALQRRAGRVSTAKRRDSHLHLRAVQVSLPLVIQNDIHFKGLITS